MRRREEEEEEKKKKKKKKNYNKIENDNNYSINNIL